MGQLPHLCRGGDCLRSQALLGPSDRVATFNVYSVRFPHTLFFFVLTNWATSITVLILGIRHRHSEKVKWNAEGHNLGKWKNQVHTRPPNSTYLLLSPAASRWLGNGPWLSGELGGKQHGLRGRQAWIQVLALWLNRFVTLSYLISLSLNFLILRMGIITSTHSVAVKRKWDNIYKSPTSVCTQ